MDQRINSFVTDSNTISRATQTFLSTVYAWMVGGLLCSGLTAWFVYTSGLVDLIVGNFILFIALLFGELALVYSIAAKIETMSKAPAPKEYYVYSSADIRKYLYQDFPNFTEERKKRNIHVKIIALGEGGKPLRMTGICIDITERKKAERENQKLLEDLRVQHEELQSQAEEIRAAQQETQEARDKYEDLYNNAPTGYLSLQSAQYIKQLYMYNERQDIISI